MCSLLDATYDDDDETKLRQISQDKNLARLKNILPAWNTDLARLPLTGRVGFRCVSTDRLPLIGALPDTFKHNPPYANRN
ncbi:MAG: hypothetical protein H7240_01420 [Glaciimonas sp.]|nr:hypothetical protein [Glaciimonas sp.]